MQWLYIYQTRGNIVYTPLVFSHGRQNVPWTATHIVAFGWQCVQGATKCAVKGAHFVTCDKLCRGDKMWCNSPFTLLQEKNYIWRHCVQRTISIFKCECCLNTVLQNHYSAVICSEISFYFALSNPSLRGALWPSTLTQDNFCLTFRKL